MTIDPQRAKALYLAALEASDPAARREFLDQQCADDNALRQRVEAFLTAHDTVTGFDAEPSDLAPVSALELRAQLSPGTIIAGRYKLIEEIGEGGMGSVWVAEQKEPVKRKVAVKLVKAGMDSRQVLGRFDAERQALAMMDHPNIAKVFDGGMTEQERPYFVMEYVKGVPLTEYCDQARLSLKERLQLFISVCQAVQHAHQKGIIHRDLKPSNILICLYDGRPVPKVIDFGLAKAMHQSLTDQSLYTAHGMMVGTPLYMSPEQAEHNNLDVDTRTDIYSLGVILYELLTGGTPLERQQMKQAAYIEILRLIKEVEPPKPSTRLSSSQNLPSIAAQRRIEPNQLKRSLTGDLDWIVMKALDKERSRRYETANGLARDVERFLNDEAVEACPPSPAYRLKKFIRRNRAMVTAVSAVAAALVIGIIGFAWQARVASYQRDLADKARASEAEQRQLVSNERDRAILAQKAESEQRMLADAARVEAENQKEAAKKAEKVASDIGKQAVNNLYIWVTEVEEKLRDRPDLADLREELVKTGIDGLKTIDGLAKDAGTAGQAFRTMGVAFQRMGDILEGKGMTAEAFRSYEQSLELFERLAKEEPNNDWIPWNFAVSYDKLGAMSQEFHGDATTARDYYRKSLALRQGLAARIQTPEIPASRRGIALSASYIKLADLGLTVGDPIEAREFAAKALQETDKLLATDPQVAAASQFRSMAIYLLGKISAHLTNELSASRKYFQESIDMRQKAVDADSNNTDSRRELGAVYDSLGDLELEQHNAAEALKAYQRAFEQYEWLNQKDANSAYDQWYLGHSYYRQGRAKLELSDAEGATQDFSQSLELRETLAKNDPKSVQMKAELMLAQARCGLSAQAAEAAENVRNLAPKNPGVLYTAACGFSLCLPAIAADKEPQSPANQALRDRCVQSAVDALEQAIGLGYRDVEALRLDPDLAPIRALPAFQNVIRKLEEGVDK